MILFIILFAQSNDSTYWMFHIPGVGFTKGLSLELDLNLTHLH